MLSDKRHKARPRAGRSSLGLMLWGCRRPGCAVGRAFLSRRGRAAVGLNVYLLAVAALFNKRTVACLSSHKDQNLWKNNKRQPLF